MRRWCIWAVLLLAMSLMSAALFNTWGAKLLRNVHSFADGEGVRTAQLSTSFLRGIITENSIQSVLCLTGEPEDLPNYDQERKLCGDLGVEYRSVEARSDELPPARVIRAVIDSWESMSHPLLIHCRRGADRTGLVVATIELLRGATPEQALRELSWRYLHLCRQDTCPLHRFFSLYQDFLTEQACDHSPELFRNWCYGIYYPPPYSRKIEVLRFPDTALPGEELTCRIRVENTSSDVWITQADSEKGIRFGVRILGPLRRPPQGDTLALETYFHQNRFTAVIGSRMGMQDGTWPPGESREFDCDLVAGELQGTYLYRLDMVDELVAWFYTRTTPATYRVLTVVDPAGSSALDDLAAQEDSGASRGTGRRSAGMARSSQLKSVLR